MGYQLLIVDDSSIVRKVLRKALGLTALPIGEIIEAENGADALGVLAKQKIDLIFLDINMPVMNGIEFMEKLRQSPRFGTTPVIVVSTEGSSERKEMLLSHDVKAYLRKPVTPEKLTEIVGSILGEQP